jgi:predicted CoA-binding protein
MNQNVQDFVECQRIAIVGASRTGKKFGNTIFTELKDRGYQAFLVHTEAQTIDGEPCYPTLAALQGRVDGVLVCVAPQKAGQVVREAVAAGIKNIWLQQGAESTEALAIGRELGVEPVAGKCILMYAQPVKGFHRLHRGFVKLIGQL